jgi:AcrR family transcriptional regulator
MIEPKAVIVLARQMIEADGVDRLSLSRLAQALNVKAPSLYRHFASKSALLRAVNLETAEALFAALNEAIQQAAPEPRARLIAMAHAYRGFVHANPRTYMLSHSLLPQEERVDPAQAESLALPLQHQMAALAGEKYSLDGLRGAWALIHGFCMLEINQQFQRGGDLDEAFTRTVEAYIQGWASSHS